MLKFFTGILGSIEYVIVALLIGLAAGFGSGWEVHGWKTDAAHVVATNATITADAKSVVAARVDGAKVETQTNKIASDTEHARQELARTPIIKLPAPINVTLVQPANVILEQPQPLKEASNANCPAPTLDVLSVYGVGVLNHALDQSYPDPAQWDAATRTQPSDTGLREVSDHLARVAGIYHTLGTDYDAVIGTVERYQDQQAKIRAVAP